MNKVRTMMMALLCLLSMAVHAQESKAEEGESLTDTSWRLIGFGTVGEDAIQKVEPQDSVGWYQKVWEYVYTVTFVEDSVIFGRSWSNELYGKYKVQGEKIRLLGGLASTKVGELYDGYKYLDALNNITSYKMNNGLLYLYYNGQQDYLLFRKSNQVPKLLVTGRRWVYKDSWFDHDVATPEQTSGVETHNKVAIHSVSFSNNYSSVFVYELFPSRWLLDSVEGVTDTIAIAWESVKDGVTLYYLNKDPFHQEIKIDGKTWIFTFDNSIGRGAYSSSVFPSPDYVKVRTDTIEVGSRRFEREIWQLDDEEYPIVKGIGCPTGLFAFDATDNGATTEFLGCYEGDELIFSPDDFYRPAISAGITTATLLPPSATDALFDLHGRRLAAPPAKGVYIQGGRKRVAP